MLGWPIVYSLYTVHAMQLYTLTCTVKVHLLPDTLELLPKYSGTVDIGNFHFYQINILPHCLLVKYDFWVLFTTLVVSLLIPL